MEVEEASYLLACRVWELYARLQRRGTSALAVSHALLYLCLLVYHLRHCTFTHTTSVFILQDCIALSTRMVSRSSSARFLPPLTLFESYPSPRSPLISVLATPSSSLPPPPSPRKRNGISNSQVCLSPGPSGLLIKPPHSSLPDISLKNINLK